MVKFRAYITDHRGEIMACPSPLGTYPRASRMAPLYLVNNLLNGTVTHVESGPPRAGCKFKLNPPPGEVESGE